MMNKFWIKILILFLLFQVNDGYTQNNYLNKLNSKQKNSAARNVFGDIENLIVKGDVAGLSKYLSGQTYLSLSNGKTGYYSVNQAYYVLEDFFTIYKVNNFRFDNLNASGPNPYATGTYAYSSKGKRSAAQVYISLKGSGTNWKITQITFN